MIADSRKNILILIFEIIDAKHYRWIVLQTYVKICVNRRWTLLLDWTPKHCCKHLLKSNVWTLTEDVTATPKLSLSNPFFVTFQIEVRWRDNNICITISHNSWLTTRWLPKMLVFDEVTSPRGLVEIKLVVWIHFLCSPLLDISGHLCANINQGLPTKTEIPDVPKNVSDI